MVKKTPQPSVDSASSQATGILTKVLSVVEAEIDRLADGGTVSGDDSTVRAATLGQKVAIIQAELRRTERADENAVRELSPAVMQQWIKLQTPEYRAKFLKEVAAIDATGRKSVLG